MKRRTYLALFGGTSIGVSGCTGSRGAGEVVVDERVFYEGTYKVELEQGDDMIVSVDNEAGNETFVVVVGPDDYLRRDEHIQTESEFRITADQGGVYRVNVYPDGRASITVTVE